MMAESLESQWTKNIQLLCKTVLDLPPSCLEFLPKPNELTEVPSHLRGFYEEYFVVGTYHLEKEQGEETSGTASQHGQGEESLPTTPKPQSKNGSLILFRYHDKNLEIVQTLPYPSAVFDLHFLLGQPVFAIVSSSGTVAIFRIAEHQAAAGLSPQSTLGIETLAIHQVFSEDIAPTYFTWVANSSQTMAITTSDGGVYLVHFSPGYDSFQILNNGEPVTKHTEYAWCCSFSSSGDRLYSGGDDNKLRLENLGTSLSSLDPKNIIEPSGLYPKGLPGHEAGVTFILPVPLPSSDEEPQLLLTGSYDDHIRIYSVPSYPSRPKVLTELCLGGGVWRLKFLDSPVVATGYPNQSVRYTILASCMHAGAKILSILGTKEDSDIWSEWKWDMNVLAEMSLHKSMNYASDVQDRSEERARICVSSSFYDRLLCVWKWDPDEGMV